jgi:hypothetical protein
MKRLAIGLLAVAAMTGALLAAQSTESVDTAAIAKIRDEGMNKSQVMETMFWLTDRYGPRLVGSTEFEEAGTWAVEQLTKWGVANPRKERFKIGKSWSLVNFHATMTSPRVMPIIGVPKAWTPGLDRQITADVVRLQIASEADCTKLRGTLKGKVVLTQPVRNVRMLDYGDGTVLRYDDKDGKWRQEALTLPPARGRGQGGAAGAGGGAGRGAGGAAGQGAGRGAAGAGQTGAAAPPAPPVEPCKAIGDALAAAGRGRGAAANPNPDDPNAADDPPAAGRGAGRGGGGGGQALNAALMRFYKTEGVAALFDRGGESDTTAGGSDLTWQQQRIDGGTFVVQSGGDRNADPRTLMPQVTLAVEHYNRMVRLLEHNVPVKVDLDLRVKYVDEAPTGGGFNVVGEIPGTDKADEIVLIGAHFDSWQGATGATDNAAGCAAMMEVLRILKSTGLRPRRTIRIGLWGAEEAGLVGSRTYATEHFGTRAEPKPENPKVAAYFNLDNGTGKIRGIWMQQNTAVEPIFRQWIAPLKDLGVDILGPRSVSQTDHTAFDGVGIPAFQFVQERYEYNSRTHHTNMDFLDRVQPADMKQIATVAAVFVWQTANREEKLPRKPAPGGGN